MLCYLNSDACVDANIDRRTHAKRGQVYIECVKFIQAMQFSKQLALTPETRVHTCAQERKLPYSHTQTNVPKYISLCSYKLSIYFWVLFKAVK